jgi:hypothetical protein
MLELKKSERVEQQEWSFLQQKVLASIQLAQSEVAATIAILDCEQERTELLAAHLQDEQDERTSTLGLLAIIVGAAGAATTGGLALAGLDTAANLTAILFGTASGGIGMASLYSSDSHELRHESNPLKEAWNRAEESQLLPHVVWAYLNEPEIGGGPLTRREKLIEEWNHSEWLGKSPEDQAHRRELFFGTGGMYTLDELRDRSQIFDVLKDEVSLIYRRIGRFLTELRDVSVSM